MILLLNNFDVTRRIGGGCIRRQHQRDSDSVADEGNLNDSRGRTNGAVAVHPPLSMCGTGDGESRPLLFFKNKIYNFIYFF